MFTVTRHFPEQLLDFNQRTAVL